MASPTILGIVILVVVAGIIMFVRDKVNKSGNSVLKGAMKVGDFFTWIRFLSVIPFIILLVIIGVASKK